MFFLSFAFFVRFVSFSKNLGYLFLAGGAKPPRPKMEKPIQFINIASENPIGMESVIFIFENLKNIKYLTILNLNINTSKKYLLYLF